MRIIDPAQPDIRTGVCDRIIKSAVDLFIGKVIGPVAFLSG